MRQRRLPAHSFRIRVCNYEEHSTANNFRRSPEHKQLPHGWAGGNCVRNYAGAFRKTDTAATRARECVCVCMCTILISFQVPLRAADDRCRGHDRHMHSSTKPRASTKPSPVLHIYMRTPSRISNADADVGNAIRQSSEVAPAPQIKYPGAL